MSEPGQRPLLTFAVAAFNQERFIREAVEAAFSQTYSPLEIILSDDCSEDRTFDIIRETAAAYRGPHRVVLNRNPIRRSLGGHINKIVEISRGELIVGAAGDDVSLPHRTRVTYDAWEWSGRRATSIHSNYFQVDETGQPIDQVFESECPTKAGNRIEQEVNALTYVRTLEPIVFGCTHTFARNLFRAFGALPEHVIHEDNALAFRSILAGRLLYINEPLVKYRVHGNNVYIANKRRSADLKHLMREEDRLRKYFRNREAMYEGFLLDLEKARLLGLPGSADFAEVLQEVVRLRQRFSLQRQFVESGVFGRFRLLGRFWGSGLSNGEIGILLRRLLPRALLLRIQLVRSHTALALSRSTS